MIRDNSRIETNMEMQGANTPMNKPTHDLHVLQCAHALKACFILSEARRVYCACRHKLLTKTSSSERVRGEVVRGQRLDLVMFATHLRDMINEYV